MANITQENINTLAQVVSSLGDGDYIYVYKSGSQGFSRIEKSTLLAGLGGMSSGDFDLIKNNVNLVQAKIDELIAQLANLGFKTQRVEGLGGLDWSGETIPVTTYYSVYGIDMSSTMYDVSNRQLAILAGSSYTNTISAKEGYVLNSVMVNGVSQTISEDSCTVTIEHVVGNITFSISASEEGVTPVEPDEPSEEDDYVSDGLVLHLDCKDWNGSTNVWASKVGDVEITLNNCTKENESDGIVFNGSNSHGSANIPNNFPQYDSATVEFVVRSMTIKNKAVAIKANEDGGAMLGYWHYPASVYGWTSAVSIGSQQRGNDVRSENSNFSGYVGMNQVRCIVNGDSKSMVTLNNSFSYASKDAGTISIGRCSASSSGDVYTAMTLLAVRVYNRPLSEAEMTQNYDKDKIYYGLSNE